jgi:AcrR family transcriptional regulator
MRGAGSLPRAPLVTVPSGRYSERVTRVPSETRARILCAAEDLVIRDGVSKLTLDAAAQEAGVSKGGILYHFPSRAALVTAMVERFATSFDADLAMYGALEGKPGDFTRAYLRATLEPTEDPDRERHYVAEEQRERHLGGALLAGVASDPELLAPLRDRFAAWQEAVEHDGLPAETATIVRLAADGLWLGDLLELAPVRGALRREVGERLMGLLDDAVAATPSSAPSPAPSNGPSRAQAKSASKAQSKSASKAQSPRSGR